MLVPTPAACIGDIEVIRLCPAGGPFESLFRTTWVSKFPMIRPRKDKKGNILDPDHQASPDVLADNHQPKEITIWYLNRSSYSRQGSR